MSTTQQPGWGTCSKCGGLFYTLLAFPANSCKAGGDHTFYDSHSLTEALDPQGHATWVNNVSVAGNQEANWAYCRRCHGLFTTMDVIHSRCKDGGPHDAGGSGNYILATQMPVSSPGAGIYYRCENCDVLYAAQAINTSCNVSGQKHFHNLGVHQYLPIVAAGTTTGTGNRTHPVHWGDTLGYLAPHYGTTVDAIVTANRTKYPNITANHIEAGWVLTIPN